MSNVEIYPDAEGGWRFRVIAANNEKVAGGEAYSSKSDAQEGVEALKRALGLESEWGFRVDSQIGWIYQSRHFKGMAEYQVEEYNEEDDELRASGATSGFHNAVLVHRQVTDWEEVHD